MIAFLIAHIVRKKTKHEYTVKFFCCLAVVIWGGASLVVESFGITIAEVTNINRYEVVLENRWGYNDGVSHFPRSIPDDAKNVRFSFIPGFLQGGGKIELCYSTSPEKISELYDRFSKITATSSESDEAKEYEEMMDGVRYNFFYTNLFEDSIFPEDFEVMVLGENDSLNYIFDKYVSVIMLQGVAISKQRNEIVYWAWMME